MHVIWLGECNYMDIWYLQKELVVLRGQGKIPDVMLLLEHPPTITLGRAARDEHVLASSSQLEEMGIAIYKTDRGGDVTFHGPGQLVGYPIIDLNLYGRDLHVFLREIEGCLISYLEKWKVGARRFPPYTGVWVGDKKIAAIGIKVSRWVTSHGFSLNIAPNWDHFRHIIPCGLADYGLTSLEMETNRTFNIKEVATGVAHIFYERFVLDEALQDLSLVLSEKSCSYLKKGVDIPVMQGYNTLLVHKGPDIPERSEQALKKMENKT